MKTITIKIPDEIAVFIDFQKKQSLGPQFLSFNNGTSVIQTRIITSPLTENFFIEDQICSISIQTELKDIEIKEQ